MDKYNTEKEITDMLRQVSNSISPTEIAFEVMLNNLPTAKSVGLPITSIYTKPIHKNKSYLSFNPMSARVLGSFSVFTFILGSIFTFSSGSFFLKNSPTDGLALQTSEVPSETNKENSNNSATVASDTPILATSIAKNNLVGSALAVASLKSSSAGPETLSLQEVLTNELSAELDAHTDLLALSE